MGIREYLDDAIRTGKTVTIKYIKYEGEYSVRQISDIQYSDEFGPDYIKAFCHKRQENRTFKISRIISVDGVTDTPITPSSTVKTPKSAYTGNSSPAKPTTSQTSSYSSGSSYRPSSGYSSTYKPSYSSSTKPSYSSSSNTKKSEGCYIATMAYGDYDHPQVMELRKYRDQVLLKSVPGRLFVRFYYWISPKMVKLLSGHDSINKAIRRVLDKMVDRSSD